MYWLSMMSRLPLFVLGLATLFAADRYLSAESFHSHMRIASVLLLAASPFLTMDLGRKAHRAGRIEESTSWRFVTIWQWLTVIGVGLYFIYVEQLGTAAIPENTQQQVLLGAWLSFLTVGFFLSFGMEWTMAKSGRGRLAEPAKLLRSADRWFSVAALLISLVCFNYFAAKTNIKSNWSYLKTAKPSESTLGLLETMSEPVQIALVYPPDSEVMSYIRPYFESIVAAQPLIELVTYDYEISPSKSREFRSGRNGLIAFRQGSRGAQIDTGVLLDNARRMLDRLDIEFQRHLLRTIADKKNIYFTQGHGEMVWSGEDVSPLRSIKDMTRFLEKQNYRVKKFGIQDGSASEVPLDAAVVAIVGPTTPFLQAEADALERFVDSGGQLLVLLDEESRPSNPEITRSWPLLELLKKWGMEYIRVPMANIQNHGVLSRGQLDRWFILTDQFSSHKSVENLLQHPGKVGIGLIRAGHWLLDEDHSEWSLSPTFRTTPSTFPDANRNFEMDKEEKTGAYILGAVGERKAKTGDAEAKISRIVLFADATMVSDPLITNQGNSLLFSDSLKWLVGDVEFMGEISSEEDVPIRHTRHEDAIWFNSTVAVVPLFLLMAGLVATRRPRPNRRRSSHAS